jgi:uncharacterized protein (DUF1810 family)
MQEITLSRFIEAQADIYDTALAEIRSGRKRSHWMWFIFPQLRGLGHSSMAQHYGIASVEEARAYLADPLLGPRYLECVEALQSLPVCDPISVFGSTDAMKLRSSLTLFETAGPLPLFSAALAKWFGSARDETTRRMLSDRA